MSIKLDLKINFQARHGTPKVCLLTSPSFITKGKMSVEKSRWEEQRVFKRSSSTSFSPDTTSLLLLRLLGVEGDSQKDVEFAISLS